MQQIFHPKKSIFNGPFATHEEHRFICLAGNTCSMNNKQAFGSHSTCVYSKIDKINAISNVKIWS